MRKPMWDIRQAKEPGVIDIYIYGDVESDDRDWWTGEVVESETSANHFRDELAKHPDLSQINVYINSYGGSVFEGTAIYNQLRRHPAKKVVHVDGFACSIASVIAMAGDEIIMPRNALMMIHNMARYVYGSADELRKAADDLDVINAAGRAAYLDKAGDKLTEDMLVKMYDAETWLTAEECLTYGLCDTIEERAVNMSQSATAMQRANGVLEQRIAQHKALSQMMAEFVGGDSRRPSEPEQKNNAPATSLMAAFAGKEKE